MDQIKIGKFIAECRKKKNLTQMQLALKLNITDRAISKWENGKSLPDSGLMIDLCNILNITVNELLCGEMININNYKENAEKTLLEMTQKDERRNKNLMFAMWTILISNSLFYAILLILACNTLEEGFLLGFIICGATILLLISGFIGLKFEVDAGYYECKNCHHKFVPTYKEVLFTTHMATTRHLRCPKCNKRTWAKKVYYNK